MRFLEIRGEIFRDAVLRISMLKWCDFKKNPSPYRIGEGFFMFQFQNGAIKSERKNGQNKAYGCFNSKMVRLKGLFGLVVGLWSLCFNSKMVRLKDYHVDE